MPRRNYPLPSVTYDASDSPTTTNDLPNGILAGSSWHDNNANKWYWCADHTNDSAVWKEMVFADDIEGIVNSLVPPMIAKSYGGLRLPSATNTTTISSNVFKKMAGTTEAFNEMNNFTMPSNNRLSYNGSSIIKCRIDAFAVGTVGSVLNGNFQLTIARGNGEGSASVISSFNQGYSLGGLLSSVSINLQCLNTLTINPSDYFELWVTSSNGSTVSVSNAQLFIKQL